MNASARKQHSHRRAALFAFAACLLVVPFLALARLAAAEAVFCTPGSGAGQCREQRGVGVDTETGRLYVADWKNNRVDAFEPDGDFVMSFGWDVVSSGPDHVPAPSEEQSITLDPSVTQPFLLDFEHKTTAPLAFNAPASGPSSVESALNGLPNVGGVGGSVAVSGPNGGPYTLVFGGSFAGDGVAQVRGVRFPDSSVVSTTLVPGGAFEVCKAGSGDVCKAGSPGPGAGQFTGGPALFDGPVSIAVDNASGSASRHDVYVGTDNNRVQKFKPDGSFELAFGWGVDTGAAQAETCTAASACQAGIEGAGKCQFSSTIDSIAVGPGGNVFVADNSGQEPSFTDRVEKFSPAGACLSEAVLTSGFVRLRSLAVDSGEDAYVTFDGISSGEVRKYDLSTNTELCSSEPGLESGFLALDEAGDLFAFQQEPRAGAPSLGGIRVVTEYDSACKIVRRFGYGQIEAPPTGLAFYHGVEGDLFVSGWTPDRETLGQIKYLTIPPPGPIVAPPSVEAGPIGNTKATVKAEVNPEGKATSYHFEYLTRKAFAEQGNSFTGPKTASTPVTPLDFAPGKEFRLRGAEATIGCPVATQQLIDEGKCLEPESEYVYRVVATNADNPTGVGEGSAAGAFTTKPSIELGHVYATEVGTDAATLNAEVNPLGIPASGYFEYVDEATYQQSGFADAAKSPDVEAGEEPIDFGAAETSTIRSATLYPLPPGAKYRYRLVGANPFLDAPLLSEEKSFTTYEPQAPEAGQCPANEAFHTGTAALLPDCRAYEMVSPLDKEGGDIKAVGEFTTGEPSVLNQSSVSGGRLAYGSYRSFGDALSAPLTSQYIAARGAGGWSSHAITPPGAPGVGIAATRLDSEFRAFSPDLCEGWIIPFANLTLAEGAIPGYFNLYRRRDQLCGGQSYEALTTAQPENSLESQYLLELQGLSADGAVAAFTAKDNLTADASPQPTGCVSTGEGCVQRLYATSGGQLRFVCVLPGGGASANPCSAGTGSYFIVGKHRLANVANAVSADGTRIFWSASSNLETGEGPIYLRENPLAEGPECAEEGSPCTIAVSKEAEEEAGASVSHYWAAAANGSAAIFSTGGGLYEFEVEGSVTRKIAGGLRGVVGASENASRVYFASTEAIPGSGKNSEEAEAEAGKPNLYLHEAGPGSGSYRFIATLSAADVSPAPGVSSATGYQPIQHNGRVSPDGLHAAFMSTAPLTGYDNTDVKSGAADNEVFAYDATAGGGAGRLICPSCNPSGARPAGENAATSGNPFWIAAQVPVFESTLYAPRVLANDGSRLFFESEDALAARDTNGRLDVYQWEELGTGGCDQADATFSADSGGCVSLVSSGKSPRDSTFVDASPTGGDVFFVTLASLLPQDYGLADIYDARVGGGFPPPSAPPVPCLGDACQAPPPPPNDSTPASASFHGAGDPVAKKKRKGAKKRHHRKHRHHRRAAR